MGILKGGCVKVKIGGGEGGGGVGGGAGSRGERQRGARWTRRQRDCTESLEVRWTNTEATAR